MSKQKTQIPNNVVEVPQGKQTVFLKGVERQVFNMPEKEDSADNQSPYIALKYFDSNYQCFSEWSEQELKGFSSFLDKLKQVNWHTLKNKSTGFKCTLHKNHSTLKEQTTIINQISEEINLMEMRVSGKARVHGFQMKSAFFIVLLDKDHDLFPE